MTRVRVQWEVAKTSLRRATTYRGATFAGAFTNTVFGFIKAYTLPAVFASRTHVGSLDRTAALTFGFVDQGFIAVISAFGWREVAERVLTGDIATDLARPTSFVGYWTASQLGNATFAVLFRGLPPFLAASLVFHLRLPTSLATVVGFVLTVAGAALVAAHFWIVVNLSAFWLVEIRGVIQLAVLLMNGLSGLLIPLQFAPDAVVHVLRATPFAACVQLPTEVFLQRQSALGVLAVQTVWVVLLSLAARLVLRAATHKLVVQGG